MFARTRDDRPLCVADTVAGLSQHTDWLPHRTSNWLHMRMLVADVENMLASHDTFDDAGFGLHITARHDTKEKNVDCQRCRQHQKQLRYRSASVSELFSSLGKRSLKHQGVTCCGRKRSGKSHDRFSNIRWIMFVRLCCASHGFEVLHTKK